MPHSRRWHSEKRKGGPPPQRRRHLPIHVAEGDDPVVASEAVETETKRDDACGGQRTDQRAPKKPRRTRDPTDFNFLPPGSSEENERQQAHKQELAEKQQPSLSWPKYRVSPHGCQHHEENQAVEPSSREDPAPERTQH